MTGLVLLGSGYAALYLIGARHARRWPVARTGCFMAGVAAVLAGLALSDDTLVIHMVGHALLVAVGAPLLVLGRPLSLALQTLPASGRDRLLVALHGRAARTLLAPAVAWVAFVGCQLAFHIGPLLWLSLRVGWVHELEHLLFLAAALAFWSVALAAEPVPRRLPGLSRAAFVFGAMPVSDGAAAYLIAVGHPLAGVAMVAAMMPLGLAALTIAWRAMLDEERRSTLAEALGAHG